MPTPIVPSDVFTDEIIAPDGDDFMDDAADVVRAIAQGLVNRTERLSLHRLPNDVDCTLEGKLTIETDSPDKAGVFGSRAPGQDTANENNPWRRIVEQVCDTSGTPQVRTVCLYAGTNDSKGAFALTVNARWHVPTQLWRQQNAAMKSMALIWYPGADGLVLATQTAGVSDWGLWPINQGNAKIRGALELGSSLTAAGVVSTADVALSGSASIVVAGEFRHPAKPRDSTITLAHAVGAYTRETNGSIKATGTTPIAWPVRVPRQSELGLIEIMHTKTTTGTSTFTVRRRQSEIWNGDSSTPPNSDDVVTPQTSATTGIHVATITGTGVESYPEDTELEIVWVPGSANDVVHMIRMVGWVDRGPRSEVN